MYLLWRCLLDREIGYLIGRIHLLSNRLLNRLLQEHNITSFNSEQGKILYQLWKNDGITMSDLATNTGLALNTLSKMLQTMEQQHLVERRVKDGDKRSKRIFLTPLSKQAQTDSAIISQMMTSKAYHGFSESEILHFEAQLRRILSNLEKS